MGWLQKTYASNDSLLCEDWYLLSFRGMMIKTCLTVFIRFHKLKELQF